MQLFFKGSFASKSFKKSGPNLCDALATLTRRLCTEYIDSATIQPILTSRLILLNRCNGQSIGVGEVIRRIIGKCVTKVTKQGILESSGSLQVCAGHKSRSEATVHAMNSLFQHQETDAVLLVDASNAFITLNRVPVLHNIRVLCPALATFAINTYQDQARLFVTGVKELISAEGTTQGDPLAMCMYALSLQPLISRLQAANQAKQCWFAGDATGCGSLQNIRVWWDELTMAGPDLGCYPNAGNAGLLIRRRPLRASLKKQQLTSPQKYGSIRVRRWVPGPILSSTLTVKSKNGWGR
ncbi:uncharacterized protein LOC110040229 [Orbicella faveolata]|uniref:uncharacterized protein LOC110040229 n=1 Tax=Orbicella faveolata TaxID=48498 RepID=UPI0009E412D9|nr:uncharacterized protein LOC110040229 [Orbicella faveolata]